MVEYKVESSFIHYDTKEKMFRVKVIYNSGGVSYHVMNEEQLNRILKLNK
jgi:hypothetical protein